MKGTNILKFIKLGEEQGINKGSTCATRKKWYELPARNDCDIIFPRTMNDRYIAYLNPNVCPNDRFYEIYCKKEIIPLLIGYLNSSIFPLLAEVTAKLVLGLGALDLNIFEFINMSVINPKISRKYTQQINHIIKELKRRLIGSVFEEIGANSPKEVSLDKVKSDRRELDKIVMGGILGLTEDEQLEVYKAVIDLVRSRIEKAKSVPKKAKKVKGLDVEALVNDVISEVGKLKRFPEDFISLEGINYKEISIPKGRAEVGQDLYGFYVEVEKEKIRCDSPYEARYIQYSSLNGKTIVKIPEDESLILKAVSDYRPIIEEALKRIDEYLNSTIPDNKIRNKVKEEVLLRITGQK